MIPLQPSSYASWYAAFTSAAVALRAEVDRLADRGVDVPLKRGLHPDVRRDVDLVRGREPPLDVGGDVGVAAHAAVLGDRREQLGRREPALGGDPLERGIDLGELGAVEDVAAIRERVERLDAARAAGDDADRSGRRDRGRGRVAQGPAGRPCSQREPSQAGKAPRRSASARRGCERLVLEERREPVGELERGVAVVRDVERDERVGPAHEPSPILRVALVARSISGSG